VAIHLAASLQEEIGQGGMEIAAGKWMIECWPFTVSIRAFD
jgi:hypothetical protein